MARDLLQRRFESDTADESDKADKREAWFGGIRARTKVSSASSALSAFLGLALLTLGACGGESGPNGGGSGFMRAEIDGEEWESDDIALENGIQYTTPGAYAIQGTKVVSGSDALSVVLSLFNIRGPGTYRLGMGGGTVGGIGFVANASGNWGTILSGNEGTVTITTLTDDRIAGTFEFTGHASLNSNGAVREVTNGEFDVAIVRNGNVAELPANAGSEISATFNGQEWFASTIAVQPTPGTLFGFSALNTEYTLSIGVNEVTAPGTYPLQLAGQVAYAAVSDGVDQDGNCCWGFGPGGTNGVGSITIEALSADRATGTFSFTLPSQQNGTATGELVVANGEFDLGLP